MLKTLAALALVIGQSAAAQDAVFPTLEAQDLNFRDVTLPGDFPGDPTVVLIAYKQNQQPDIDAWVGPLGLKMEGGQAWVELPVVGFGYKAAKTFIDNGMRSGITDTEMRARTITIYGRRAVNSAIGVTSTSEIQVLVVGQDGRILAQASGDVTPQKVATILDALK